MPLSRLLPLTALIVLSGCVYGVRERTDRVQCDLALKPYDLAPPGQTTPKPPPAEELPSPKITPGDGRGAAPTAPTDVQTAALLQPEAEKPSTEKDLLSKRLTISGAIPGSEAQLPTRKKGMTDEEWRRVLEETYPNLEPLEPLPAPGPGPTGKPYTLADLQAIAIRFSPTVNQAASDVEAARGNMIQARAYPNPTITYTQAPSSSGLSSTSVGVSVTQTLDTGGKLKEAEAAARMALANSELALKRARSDLATSVRNAYFGLLVAEEAMRVNRAIAQLTNEVFLIQRELSASGIAAHYETATLRGQADVARLAYRNSIYAYLGAWRTLVAAVGLRERDMPLSQVAGRVDAFVPIYDYDKVLAHVLTNHTDILAARNSIEQARYNLKLQQITPWYQNLSVSVGVQRDFTLPPGTFTPTVSVSSPLSVWDQNKGNIIAAEAALTRALQQPHAAEQTWTTNVAAAFSTYRQNLQSLEDYRRHILPNQVLAYRGIVERRKETGAQALLHPVAFADFVAGQQALTGYLTNYLGILGTLWTSVVSVADPLQTDDLFQLAEPMALPPLPDLDHLPSLPCGHNCSPAREAGCAPGAAHPAPSTPVHPLMPPVVQRPAPADVLPARLPAKGDEGTDSPASSEGTGGPGQ
jgi:cobalt-zinc-cadmium efflux system outer membrane protein